MLAVAFLGLAANAGAADVTLVSRDGSLRLDGRLTQFDGEFYRIDSVYGLLTVDATGVVCEGPGCPDLTAYVAQAALSGPGEVLTRLIPALIEGFAQEKGLRAVRQPDVGHRVTYDLFELGGGDGDAAARLAGRFRLSPTSSAEGFADLIAAEADIAVSLREVLPDEVALAAEAGLGRLDGRGQSLIVALDALVPAVAPGAAWVAGLTPGALAQVLSGEVGDWGQLGGPEGWPVAVYLPPEDGALAQVLTERLMAVEGRVPSGAALRLGPSAALVDALAADSFGFGVVPLSALGPLRPVALRGACGFDLSAQRDSVKSEDWPLTTPVYAYMPQGRAPALVREFLAFTQSSAASAAVRSAGFVDQAVDRSPFASEGERLAKAIRGSGGVVDLGAVQGLVAALSGSDRLSLAFRFSGGSATLDAPSRANVALLADLIGRGAFDGDELHFAGFTDGEGAAAGNLRLSRSRAETVMRAVRAAIDPEAGAQVAFRAEGFGQASPLACDDSDWGRQVNRRVEVWVRPHGPG
jgi:phosphate transport system substrate-binding protein